MNIYIRNWQTHYNESGQIEVDNATDLGSNYLGLTRYHYLKWDPESQKYLRCCTCYVNKCVPTTSWMYLPVLWHEYCHTQEWLAGSSSGGGHGPAFLKRLFRKPLYALASIPAAFLFVYYRMRDES